MCGICGSTHDPSGSAIAAMNATMIHRGPDDEGTYVDREAGMALGARPDTAWAVLVRRVEHPPHGTEGYRAVGTA